MRILDHYLGQTILVNTLIVLLVLLSLLGFLEFMDEVQDVGKGKYQLQDAAYYTLFTLPRYTYEIFPIAALLGSLLGLGNLASHSELIAMRAAGISLRRIVFAVIKTGFWMMFAAVIIGELLAPFSAQQAQRIHTELLKQQIALHTTYGFWSREGRNVVNIGQLLPNNKIADVRIYQFDTNNTLEQITRAENADYQGDHWLLQQVKQTHFAKETAHSQQFEQLPWKSLLTPETIQIVAVQPHMLPAWELYRYIETLRTNGQNPKNYEVAFWNKLITPVVTLIMLLLSVPFVFGVLRTVGIGKRVFIGLVVGVAFFLVNKASANIAIVYDLNAMLAAAFPSLLVSLVAFGFFARTR